MRNQPHNRLHGERCHARTTIKMKDLGGQRVARMHTAAKIRAARAKKNLDGRHQGFYLEARPGIEPGLTALQAAT